MESIFLNKNLLLIIRSIVFSTSFFILPEKYIEFIYIL